VDITSSEFETKIVVSASFTGDGCVVSASNVELAADCKVEESVGISSFEGDNVSSEATVEVETLVLLWDFPGG